MKYSISINQLVLSEPQHSDIDVVDAAILDYLICLCNSRSVAIAKYRKNQYTWVNYSKLIKEMPILRIRSAGAITPRIKRLEKTGFIKTKRIGNQKLYVSLTGNVDKLFMKLNSSDKLFTKLNSSVHETKQHYKEDNNIKLFKINIPFENFWNLYDKKVNRPKCEKKWLKLSDSDRAAIINYIPKYKAATPEKRYRKNPETFLNNRSWEDEIIEKDDKKSGIRVLHDGTKAIFWGNRWVDARDKNVSIDLSYYPELTK